MSWKIEYLTPVGQVAARIFNDFPYLSALVSAQSLEENEAYARASNYLAAVRAEEDRPVVARTQPYHLVLDPSNICNLRCPLCVHGTGAIGRKRSQIDEHIYSTALEDLKRSVIRVDLFSWGEPFLHPRLPEVIKHATDFGYWARTSSHFSVNLPYSMEEVVESGLKYLVVSIDGATQATYEEYRRRGRLDLILGNLRKLVAVKQKMRSVFPIIDWQYIVFAHNATEVNEAKRIANDIGVDAFSFGGGRAMLANRTTLDATLNFNASESLLVDVNSQYSVYGPKGVPKNAAEQKGCRWLWGKMVVQADGGVSPCWNTWSSDDDLGRVAPGVNLNELWTSDKYRTARTHAIRDEKGGTQCATCAQNRAYVNAPDSPDREFDAASCERVVSELQSVGIPINVGACRAVARATADFSRTVLL